MMVNTGTGHLSVKSLYLEMVGANARDDPEEHDLALAPISKQVLLWAGQELQKSHTSSTVFKIWNGIEKVALFII